jgi:hypothetical protein
MNPMAYWERVATVMNYLNPEVDENASLLVSLLKPLGVVPGKAFEPDERQQRILAAAAHSTCAPRGMPRGNGSREFPYSTS